MQSVFKKFLYFDLGNVIVNFDHERAVQRLQSHCSSKAEVYREFLTDSAAKRQYETGQISSQDFFDQFCGVAKCNLSREKFLLAVSDIFWLNAPIMPLIMNLKFAGYRLGILSNTCESHWDFLVNRIVILSEYFDCHVLSHQVHCLKPDLEIYRIAEKMAATDAENIFYVDDRPEHVEGAKAAGWIAERFESVSILNQHLSVNGIVCNY